MNTSASSDAVLLDWLLEDTEPGVRYLALRDLVGLDPSDPTLKAACQSAHSEGPISAVLAEMAPEGYWVKPGPGYNPKYTSAVWALILLAQLGARIEADHRLHLACEYLLEHALTPGGYFTASGAPSGTADCLQGNLCWSLLTMGMPADRLAPALDWMARSVTGEDIAPQGDRTAPRRYYAGNCGPTFACGSNNKLPCAWGAAKVMLALGKIPPENRTAPIERAISHGIEFLFSVDPSTAAYPSGFSSKPSRNWWKFGFPVFYVTDILQLAEALVALGYGADPRLDNTLTLIQSKRAPQGGWSLEYHYAGKTWIDFGPPRQPNKWVTLRALKVRQHIHHL